MINSKCMKKEIITFLLFLCGLNLFGQRQNLKNPLTKNKDFFYFSESKTFIIKDNFNENSSFTIPSNELWIVSTNCDYCGLKVSTKTKYSSILVHRVFYTEEKIDFLPVILYPNSSFFVDVLVHETKNYLYVDIYRMELQPKTKQ